MNRNLKTKTFMKKYLFFLVIVFFSSCSSIFKKQANEMYSKSIISNPCYNDRCTVKSMIQLMALTKSKWSQIKFEDEGVEELKNILTNEIPQLTKELNSKRNKSKSEKEVFQILLRKILDKAKENDQIFNTKSVNEGRHWLVKLIFDTK